MTNPAAPSAASLAKPCTAFIGCRRLASGRLDEVARVVKTAADGGATVLVFDDAAGTVVDLDLRGTPDDVVARLRQAAQQRSGAPELVGPGESHGRGRPKLGVIAREVTLLPRHWEWLAAQPGGASVTLRKLVEAARRAGAADESGRVGREAAYRFMSAMAGDLPGFEEAIRALFAQDDARFEAQMAAWPTDIRAYALALAKGDGRIGVTAEAQ